MSQIRKLEWGRARVASAAVWGVRGAVGTRRRQDQVCVTPAAARR